MPKVRFLKTRTIKDGTGTTYEEGKVYDLPQSSVERWEKRGLVELASGNAKAVEPTVVSVQGDKMVPVEPVLKPSKMPSPKVAEETVAGKE